MRRSNELRANCSDVRTALKIALSTGEESAIWKRGERGDVMVEQAEQKHRPLQRITPAQATDGHAPAVSCANLKGRGGPEMNLRSVSIDGDESAEKNMTPRSILIDSRRLVAQSMGLCSVLEDGEEWVAENTAPCQMSIDSGGLVAESTCLRSVSIDGEESVPESGAPGALDGFNLK